MFHLYRQIRVLSRLYDEAFEAVYIPTLITTACSCLVISLYACVKLHQQIPMPGLAFFPLLAMDGFCAIVIIKEGAGVFINSKRFLEVIGKKSGNLEQSAEQVKVASSLGKIRVHFGASNYIDELTAFVIMHCCVVNAVNLMLVT